MKLSEMQKILKEYEDKYGDIEIVRYYIDTDEDLNILKNNFSATAEDPNPYKILYIRLWV